MPVRPIPDIHIRKLDLTALVVFEKLLARQNMSIVAKEVGLTQSAISHAIARLRSVFDDQLFVRSGVGVKPTPRALQLAKPLTDSLEAIRNAMQIGGEFDPDTAARHFVVAGPDTLVAALAPSILATFVKAAPHCTVAFRSLGNRENALALVEGEVDLAFGLFVETPQEAAVVWARRETYAVAARRNHPCINGKIDLHA